MARAPLPRGGATTRTLGLPLAAAARRVPPALGLAVLFMAARLLIALSAPLRETYYDQALTGLMSLAILRAVPQVFYWGQPYLGAVDAYLAAGAFYVFGASTLVLRLGVIWISVLWVWAAWRIGRKPPGRYPLRLGVWLPSTGRRLFPLTSDVPQAHRSVTIGTLVVTP